MERIEEVHQLSELIPEQVKNSDNFEKIEADEVELTELEKEEALRKCRAVKAAKINERRYWENLNKPVEFPPMTASQLGRIILKHATSIIPGFVVDDQSREPFKLLCQYFTRDAEFEAAGYSLKKGLLLFGPVGCGKTSLMKIFQQNTTNDYAIRSCRTVADDYSHKDTGGAPALEKYSELIPCYPNHHYGQTALGMCFDDLGTEKSKKHFGNEINVMEDVFQNRYDNGLIGKTHLTTNLNAEDINQMYGARVRSRLREMCNMISFSEESFDRRW